jgi:apolipoprotein N-acyltransferase
MQVSGRLLRRHWLLASLTGVLLALSFPKFGHPASAWVSLVPLILAVRGATPLGRPSPVTARQAILLGWWAGLIYFAGTVYWTSGVLAQFGGLPMPVAALAMLLLAAYLALYPAAVAGVAAACLPALGDRALAVVPAAWAATELMRGAFFGGFPWVPLGNSQVEVLPIAQLASVIGVFGLSGCVAAVNVAVAVAFLSSGRTRWVTVAAASIAVAAAGGWGAWRIARADLLDGAPALRVGLVQANIAQNDKWDPRQARRIITTYMAMSRDVVRRGAEYVVWPESSTPAMFEEDAATNETVRALAAELRVPLLFGSDQFERGENPRYYNAAFLLGPDGRTQAVYRKIQLVPFGEFFPLQEWLSFVSPLVERAAPFAAGAEVVMLPAGMHRASTAICYEVVYPRLAREAVLAGSELLTTITNDAWYGETSAPFQHFAMAAMRSIEQGRYLARAANTGVSGIIDPYGRVTERSNVFEQVGLVGEVRFIQARTTYAAAGDVVPWAGLAVVAVALIAARRRAPVTGGQRGHRR